jgi:hypothetical protein
MCSRPATPRLAEDAQVRIDRAREVEWVGDAMTPRAPWSDQALRELSGAFHGPILYLKDKELASS